MTGANVGTEWEPQQPSNWPSDWLSETLTDRLIARLNAAHSGRLSAWAKMPEQATVQRRLWAKSAGGLSNRQLKRGLELSDQMQSPPTPVAFRNLCLGAREHQNYVAIGHEKSSAGMDRSIKEEYEKSAKSTRAKRCIYSKGYGIKQHLAMANKCMENNLPLYVADMRAMRKNGWSESKESGYRAEWCRIPGNRLTPPNDMVSSKAALYTARSAPPDWVLSTVGEDKRTDIDQWIKTGELPEWAKG